VAKRSPILGYNHNVRYRGLVFHVQTEDSGVLSPHLFTHLFFTGVIISTRKLVYDAGSGEEPIKSLMQAQHKAVLKDLRRGHFDDKIDEYLAGTPGLLPRGVVEEGTPASREARDAQLARASTPIPVAVESEPELEMLDPADLEMEPELVDTSSTRREERRHDPTIPDVRRPHAVQPPAARTVTAERKSAPSQVRTSLIQQADVASSLDDLGAVATAVATNNATVRTPMIDFDDSTGTPETRDFLDSAPEIEIQLELDEPDEPPERSRRDTDLALPGGVSSVIDSLLDDHTRPTIDVSQLSESLSDGIPSKRQPGESIPPLPPPPARPSAVGAASLPPARPITRPPARPAITPPQVVSRPLSEEARAGRRESDAIEVYAPAPPSAEAPPGARAQSQPDDDRPGVYAQHKRTTGRIPVERSAIPIPPGLGRPGRSQQSGPIPKPIAREPSPGSTPIPVIRQPGDGSGGIARGRTPTPARISSPTGPTPSRTGSSTSGGVVMTRPAVIVGAPAKASTPPRVRKAREDEGRGFGQGLISEKSLDEVILAYLSEDADDK
jgi:hypothetical protein